jgi:hypothetical protein
MYRLSKLVIFCFVIFIVKNTFAQDTLLVEKLSYIDSSASMFKVGVRPLLVDNSNTACFFYVSCGSNSDFVYLTTSNNSGQNWSTPEVVSTHEHPVNNKYYAQGPTATIDDDGYIHVVYPYRGTPLYINGWDNYPPTHINHVTNESGDWMTFVDVINDSSIQASEGNGATVSYLYWPAILSKNNMEYFAAPDYAWWATKSHVVYSERGADGIWSEGSALVTYERGAIDKHTIYCATIVTDAANIYSLWFNRFTGELKAKTNSSGVWGADENIFTSSYSIDGVSNAYSMSSISGNGKCQVLMSRMENSYNYKELFFLENNGVSWSADIIAISDSLNFVTAYEKNDTTNIFYRYYFQNFNKYGYKFLTHTGIGFSAPAVISVGENKNIYNIVTAEHHSGPLICQYFDEDKAMWFLCSGELSDLATGIEDSKNNTPTDYSLKQNYPNPFNPETIIEFQLPETGIVTIKIYNMLGQLIKTLVDENKTAGSHSVKWNGKDENGKSAASGIYIYQMKTNGYQISKKMITLK